MLPDSVLCNREPKRFPESSNRGGRNPEYVIKQNQNSNYTSSHPAD